jgi:hypothetical protein
MEAISDFKTPANIYQSTGRSIPNDTNSEIQIFWLQNPISFIKSALRQKEFIGINCCMAELYIQSPPPPPFCMTTFIASLTNLTPLLPQSRDNSCYVIRPILAPPALWLQKNTDLCAHEFAHFPVIDINLGSLTVPASAAGDFAKLILLFDSTHVNDHCEFRIREEITYFVQTKTCETQAQHYFISPTLQKGHFHNFPRYLLVDLWIVVRIPVWTNHTHSTDSCPILEFKHPTVQCVPRVNTGR